MRKRVILLFLTSVVLLACMCGLPSIIIPTVVIPTAYIAVTEPPAATSYFPATEPPLATATAVTGVTVVRLHPQHGSLMAQISAEVQKAAALGQKMFVEFDATW